MSNQPAVKDARDILQFAWSPDAAARAIVSLLGNDQPDASAVLPPVQLYGPIGEDVKATCDYSEADPVATYSQAIIMAGSIMGASNTY